MDNNEAKAVMKTHLEAARDIAAKAQAERGSSPRLSSMIFGLTWGRPGTCVMFVRNGEVQLDLDPYSGFTSNEIMVRAETRCGLRVIRPKGIVKNTA